MVICHISFFLTIYWSCFCCSKVHNIHIYNNTLSCKYILVLSWFEAFFPRSTSVFLMTLTKVLDTAARTILRAPEMVIPFHFFTASTDHLFHCSPFPLAKCSQQNTTPNFHHLSIWFLSVFPQLPLVACL